MLSACGFESLQAHHVAASAISLAATFFKSHRALILLLLLFKQNPLRTVSDRAMIGRLRITAEMYVSRGKNS